MNSKHRIFPPIVVLLILFICPFIGVEWISPFSLIQGNSALDVEIFWKLRVPRVLLAFLAGGALSIGGVVFQAMFQNALTTPFTLGVASGASLGASLALSLGLSFSFMGCYAVSWMAYLGAFSALLLVWGLSTRVKPFSVQTMLLSGIAVTFLFGSLIVLIQFTSDFFGTLRILRWLMGGLEGAHWGDVSPVFLSVLPVLILLYFLAPQLDLLSLGEELALSRGVDVKKARLILFGTTSFLVGGVVAHTGPIGFVGLVGPHVCRLMVGPLHKRLVLYSFFMGGGFLCLCDTLARTAFAPNEMPVGIVTALLGGPFFIYLLLRKEEGR